MTNDNGKKISGNEWLLRFAATLLGILAAAAITWNYGQLESMKVEEAENTILLKRLIESGISQEAKIQTMINMNNEQERTIQELSINQRNILKTMDDIHTHVVGSRQ